MSAKEKVKQTVLEDVERVKALSSDAARSGAYLYPLKVGWLADLVRFENRSLTCMRNRAWPTS